MEQLLLLRDEKMEQLVILGKAMLYRKEHDGSVNIYTAMKM